MRVAIAAAALVALPSLAMAVSVSNFGLKDQKPLSIQDTRCAAAYNQQISGCSDSDFQEGLCTAACVKGAQAIAKTIQAACANVDFRGETEDENIIVCFLDGQKGPKTICPNNDISEPINTSMSLVNTRTSHAAETSSATSSSKETLTASTTALSIQETVISSPSSIPPTSPEQEATGAASSLMSAPSSSQSSRNDGSGGGSPFDEPSGAAIFPIPMAMGLFMAVLLATGVS